MKEVLYARTSDGSIKVWSITIDDAESSVHKIVTRSGLFGGIQTPQITAIHEGKNIGRLNETTQLQQAILEANSKIARQKKKGYKSIGDIDATLAVSLNINKSGVHMTFIQNQSLLTFLEKHLPKDNTDDKGNIKPMKCQQYYVTRKVKGIERIEPRIKFPCIGQPKINGIRAFMRWVDGRGAVLFSKMGLEYNLPLITDQFTENHFYATETSGLPEGTELIFDGEIYIHGEYLSEIRSAAVKPNLKTQLLQFYIFDLAVADIKQQARLRFIQNNIGNWGFSNVHGLVSVNITSDDTAQYYTDICIKNGYEGAIFRDHKSEYGFGKRPMTIVKLKRRESAEFIILDVIDSRDAPELGMFVCRNDLNHETFTVVPEGTVEQKRQYFIDRDILIGKLLTVEFYERTVPPKELPFHAVGIAVRDYE